MLIYIKDAIMFMCAIFMEYWYFIIGVIALCFLMPIFVKCLYALISRIAFVAKLSYVCRKKGAILQYRKLPICSLFKNHKSIDLCITFPEGDKAYDIKFFPKIPFRRIIFLSESGRAYISKATIQTYVGKKGGIPGGSPTTLNYSETAPLKISLSLPKPRVEAQSILLFQPGAFDVRVVGRDECYFGYSIFDGKEFINYLLRT